ncbi:hypothetical protein PVK06_034418 [Gossypium arboreum]|uniref:Aminotransferase-like plant mobile domain-containing protein n=1 Tax=Gossypium arboreum TaxID=29729 RepID=A0ABR0NG89_GOSAR|nr:hypothetical protein PVK06_034418 [Gossypium arboreum]
MFDLWYDLIFPLVERWHPETHTFHLLCGECTVTLEDVALQLGVLTDRSAVTGVSTISELVALCYSLIGVSPKDVESKFTVPSHMRQLGAYKPEVEPELERSHTYFENGSYHPKLRVNDYFLGPLGHEYHSEFDIFSPVPSQYNTPLGPYPSHYSTPPRSYPPQYSTPPGSSLMMAFEAYDFSSMFRTPPPTAEENGDSRDHPQCEH